MYHIDSVNICYLHGLVEHVPGVVPQHLLPPDRHLGHKQHLHRQRCIGRNTPRETTQTDRDAWEETYTREATHTDTGTQTRETAQPHTGTDT